MTDRASRKQAFLYCLKVFLAVRLAMFALSLIAGGLIPARTLVSVPGWADRAFTPGWHNLFTGLEHQDALWYLRIATIGYRPTDGSAAFFPLYPWLIRIVSPLVGGHPLAAALLISNLSFLGALYLLYDLSVIEFSDSVARRTVLYISVFPAAIFFFAPYSESLFLLLSVAAFRAARRDRWPLGGVAGALSALTRSVGVFIAPALVVEGIHRWREERHELVWKLMWSAVAGAGLLIYLGYWQRRGNWAIPLHLQQYWQRQKTWPWMTLVHATSDAFHSGAFSSYYMLDWLITVPALAAAAYGIIKLRPSYSVFTWLCLLAPLSFVFAGRPLMSMPRFIAVLFPIFWVAALATEERRTAHEALVAVSAVGLGIMTVLFANAWYVF